MMNDDNLKNLFKSIEEKPESNFTDILMNRIEAQYTNKMQFKSIIKVISRKIIGLPLFFITISIYSLITDNINNQSDFLNNHLPDFNNILNQISILSNGNNFSNIIITVLFVIIVSLLWGSLFDKVFTHFNKLKRYTK